MEGAGERFFDDSVRGGTSLLSRFLLLINRAAPASTMEAGTQLAKSFADIVELRPTEQKGITLVRPDGYVAYTSHLRDGIGEIQTARQVLERQTMPAPDSTQVA